MQHNGGASRNVMWYTIPGISYYHRGAPGNLMFVNADLFSQGLYYCLIDGNGVNFNIDTFLKLHLMGLHFNKG